MTQPICGARYEITVDGKPRSNRDTKTIALEAGAYPKPAAKMINDHRGATNARPQL